MGREESRGLLNEQHGRLMRWLANHSGKELYSCPMKGANTAWAPGRWVEAAGASHYRPATKHLRAWIKKAVS